ncbi:MAG: RICIN domain-containing protein [Saprospiraceae bacterium]|nr:RICIN domain-containing protein [Saprospiraceae bacterium]
MKPQPIFSFAIFFTLLTLFPKNHSIQPITRSDREATKSEALSQLRNLIGTVTDQVSIQDEDFQLLSEDNKGVHLAGTASLFGIQNIGIQAAIGNTLIEITNTFPAGASQQIRISGQNLADWLPDFLRNKLDLTQIQMQFYPKENNRLVLNAMLGQPSGGALVEYNGFAISQPALTFSLARTGGPTPSTTATAALGGNLKLGVLDFDLAATANTNREWAFIGTLNQLKVTDLIHNIGSHLNLTMPPMPSVIENFTIQQASLALDSDRSVRFKGACDLGKVEAFFSKQTGQATDFLLGFAPNADYKLAKISSALKPIDDLGLSDLALVYSATAEKIEQELELLNEMQLGSQTVKAGLTLMGGFELPANLPGMSQTGKVIMRANLPPSLTAAPSLQAVMQFNGLQLGSDFRINESFLQLAPMDLSFGAGLSLGAKLDGNWINFTGLGDIAAPATFGLVVFMEEGSIWKNPFGVKGVEISNLGLDIGADVLSPIPRPKLGVSGALKVGPFQGFGAGMLDTGNPINSLISLKLNQMGMQQFVNAFTSVQVQREINKLPAQLRDFGLNNAELTIIPKTTEMAGRTYTQGLRVAGRANIAGLGARLDVNAGFDSGYKGDAAVSPIIIKEGNTVIFQLTGNNAADSARMAIDMTYGNFLQPKNPFYLIDGKVGLLGMSNQTKVEINKDGVYFYNKGKLFGKFEAELDAKGGNFNDVKGFYIRAAMKNELIQYLNQQATGEIDKATKASQNEYRKAIRALEDAKADLKRKQDALDRAIRIKNEKDSELAKAWDKVPKELCKTVNYGLGKKKFCIPVPTHSIPDKVCKKFPVVGNICVPMPSHNNLKTLIGNAEKAARDAAAEVTSSKTSRDIAQGTLTAAQGVVDGWEKVSTGSMKAAKWIVDKGLGGVIDVRSAEFAGQLDILKGGNVSMKANVKFLDNGYNAGFTFNFNDPLSGAKALADMLLKDRAPKGYAPEFGSQIGQKNYTTTAPPVAPTSSSIKPGKFYKIQARHSGKYMYIASESTQSGAVLVQHEAYNGSNGNNLFSFEPTGDGYYVITAKHSGKALDVNEGSTADGKTIIQWDIHKAANQQFKLEPTGDGYYFIVARHSGKAWDVNGGSQANSAGIIQWTKHGGANQQFKLE